MSEIYSNISAIYLRASGKAAIYIIALAVVARAIFSPNARNLSDKNFYFPVTN